MNSALLRESALPFIHAAQEFKPDLCMILGSGWGPVIDTFSISSEIDYTELPVMGKTGVKGHKGRLILADHENVRLLIFQGRRHWYEGDGWEPVAFPVFMAKESACRNMLLTNAAGSLDRNMTPGSLMLITDHINMMGASPLLGTHDTFWGERFPDQSEVYNRDLRNSLTTCAERLNITLHSGVYAANSGPTYETPAEVRALQTLGASAVGMSTVPEAILANAAGIRIAALSCLTNYASGISESPLGHQEVLDSAEKAMPDLQALVTAFIQDLPG